jgi:hypothetical protein
MDDMRTRQPETCSTRAGGERKGDSTVTEITLEEQIRAAKREMGLRRKLYPGFIQRGTMTQDEATYQLACQAAIIVTLTRRLEQDQEHRQMALFGGD